jgi:uncharacterized surface anchored protein
MSNNQTQHEFITRKSTRVIALLVAIISLFAMALQHSTASAAEGKLVDAVTKVVVDKQEVQQYNNVTVKVSWTAPADTAAGDYFTIGLPKEFSNLSNEDFNLNSPDGTVVANCSVKSQLVTCVFTDYVEKFGSVKGDLNLIIRADKSNSGDKGHWEINGKSDDTIPVPDVDPYDPGPTPGPDTFDKNGWISDDNGVQVITWAVMIGSQKFLYKGSPVTLTDTIDEKLTLYPDYASFVPNIRFTDDEHWHQDSWQNMKAGTDFTYTTDKATHSFTISFNEESALVKTAVEKANSGDLVVELFYNTRPYQPKKGESYSNHIEANSGSSADSQFEWNAAGGNGEGIGASVVLTKKDETSSSNLQGAVFNLVAGHDGQGAILEKGLTTDQSGKISVDGLFKGQYSFVETTAPQGYEKVAPLNFSIDNATFTQGGSIALTLNDPRSSTTVSWAKVDADNPKTLLSGSQWKISRPGSAALTVVDNGLNDTDPAAGKISVKGLAWGTYTLKEIKAPEGYQLSKAETSFSVDAAHTDVQLAAIKNTRSPEPVKPTNPPTPSQSAAPQSPKQAHLAKTGSNIGVFAGICIAALIIGSTVVIISRRRTNS